MAVQYPETGHVSGTPRQYCLRTSSMESYAYTIFPAHLSNIYIALFTGVKNAAEVRSRIIKAANMDGVDGEAERQAVNFAFINAKLVRSSSVSWRCLRIDLTHPWRLRAGDTS